MPEFAATRLAEGIPLPLVDIVIDVRERGVLVARALVDSGADLSIVPAEALRGLIRFGELAKSESVYGAGGSFEIRRVGGTLGFLGIPFAHGIAIAAPGSGLPYPVLGREDFFRRFEVLFRWHRPVPAFSIEPAA